MKRDLRIVFMGTPDFAVETLSKLLDHGYDVVGVITAPDKPAGRGRKLNESAVKKFALKKSLNILQPINLKSKEFIDELESLQANLQIVVAFRMLPKVVWQRPEYGTFNLHASLLPNYRGAAPINWAIINGETKTGVTTFFIDDKIDTGELILQKEIAIEETESAGSLHDKLMTLGSELVIETVSLLENGEVKTTPQPEISDLKTAYKLNRDNCRIDWSEDLHRIYDKVRGLNPYPAAWALMQNGTEELNVKIYEVEKIEASHNYDFGTITIEKSTIKVAVKNGFIQLLVLKLPGKRKMDVKSLLNGFNFELNFKML